MSQKDIKAVIGALQLLREHTRRRQCVDVYELFRDTFASYLQAADKAFDRERFIRAADGKPEKQAC